jgi:hypothetical protein
MAVVLALCLHRSVCQRETMRDSKTAYRFGSRNGRVVGLTLCLHPLSLLERKDAG